MRNGLMAGLLAASAGAAFAQGGEVRVYNWSDYIGPDTIADFEAATGIRVIYDVYDSNEVLEAKMLAGNSGYDIVVPTSSFLKRQIDAGVYLPLDKAKIPNIAGLDAEMMARVADKDPDNAHAVIYMWGTNGIGYNPEMVRARLGEDAPVDSWALIFDPENAAKLADCGITVLDSPTDMLPVLLNYLGYAHNSTDEAQLNEAAALIETIRPHIRYFHSSQYISDLANGEICVAVGWSGDVIIAADRAAQAGQGIEVEYSIPTEGTLQWFDMMAIPVDAPNPENAHAFIDFVLQPEVIAGVTNFVFYSNAVLPASLEFVDEEIRNDPTIFPPEETLDKLFGSPVYGPADDRLLTRIWTRVRTGQ